MKRNKVKKSGERKSDETKNIYDCFFKVYPLLVQKAERKGRTKSEVDAVIGWLTGYDSADLQGQILKNVDYETFFSEAPQINPNAAKITGVVCGHRAEEIEDPLMQKIRWFEKLVDESAKGKPMEKLRVASLGLRKLFKLLRRKDKGWSHFPKDTPK